MLCWAGAGANRAAFSLNERFLDCGATLFCLV